MRGSPKYDSQTDCIGAQSDDGVTLARVGPKGGLVLLVPETPTSILEELCQRAEERWGEAGSSLPLYWRSPRSADADATEDSEPSLSGLQAYIEHTNRHSVRLPQVSGRAYRCPCCRFFTLGERGALEICDVCYWEDDGQDDQDANLVRGGPNYELSLARGRKNYCRIGASRKEDRRTRANRH